LLKNGNIRLSHSIPSAEELKRHTYCKWHNSFSHATNDCNVFRCLVQSAVNSEMQVDKAPFPVHTNIHTLDLNNPKVLIWPEQAKGAKGKNVIIGEPRPNNVNDKVLVRKVVLDKAPDGKESLKVTINAPRLGGQESPTSDARRPAVQVRPVRPVPPTGQTGPVIKPGPSSQSVRKWVLGRRIGRRCREDLQIRDLPLVSC